MADHSESAQQNPASNADGKSLATLFRTDPLELSEQDRQRIIDTFRKERTAFLQRESEGKSAKKTSSKKTGGKKSLDDLDLSVDDIDV